jgi:hypothetical protein
MGPYYTDMALESQNSPSSIVHEVGRHYIEAEDGQLPEENTERISQIYSHLSETIFRLYREIPIAVVFQTEDPYDDYQDMKQSVNNEEMLRVYSGHADHPEFDRATNLMFRAVHDWHGHLSADVDFSPEGEYEKYCYMKKHFSSVENRVMFAEVVGQVCAVHYLENGFEDERYEQRAFLAPEWWQMAFTDIF